MCCWLQLVPDARHTPPRLLIRLSLSDSCSASLPCTNSCIIRCIQSHPCPLKMSQIRLPLSCEHSSLNNPQGAPFALNRFGCTTRNIGDHVSENEFVICASWQAAAGVRRLQPLEFHPGHIQTEARGSRLSENVTNGTTLHSAGRCWEVRSARKPESYKLVGQRFHGGSQLCILSFHQSEHRFLCTR